MAKASTSNLVHSLGLPKPTIKPHPASLFYRSSPEIGGFPFNISTTAEASDFKFGMQLVFAKAHHKITPREKSGGGHGLGELPENWGFPFNISATAALFS